MKVCFCKIFGRYQEAVDKLNAALGVLAGGIHRRGQADDSAFAALRKNPEIGRAEAMRRSIRTLIADRSSANNADASIWAPFVLVGEGG
jgi:hypothetical protein